MDEAAAERALIRSMVTTYGAFHRAVRIGARDQELILKEVAKLMELCESYLYIHKELQG